MPEPQEIVLGQGPALTEDDLRLPRPPGVIRRFWTRHPLLADILIALTAFLISLPMVTASAPAPEGVSGWGIAITIVLSIVGCVCLVWRRRWPIVVFIVAMLPTVIVDAGLAAAVSGPASVVALYTVAVYRSVRGCWIAFGAACAALALNALGRIMMDPDSTSVYVNVALSTMVGLLFGVLVGVNVGNRKRYLDALIDRSRQLIVERDQQARLAAAAERARIAREMHDIVSHSLTVVVALAEGATATADPERSKEATRAVATTAREALSEMRMMLGVLRTDSSDSDVPLGPILDASLHDVVDAARGAGFPVSLTVSGNSDVSAPDRLAVLRVAQEGVTNAMRYSRDASFIRVATAYSDEGIRITVENDGAQPAAASEGTGSGLAGLQQRVSHLGGTLAAGMAGPGLWRLSAVLPAGAIDD